jgi:predicted dehydrogenase
LQRVQWTITNWFRPEAYYGLSDWRATWKGEGGGVLINQALHNLDVLQWLCGMPARVRAYCQFGHDHNIEVEDRVIAYGEYAAGATCLFTTSTGEAPGVNRLEIAGTRALVLLENDVLRLSANSSDSREYSRSTDNAFGMPEVRIEEYPLTEENPSHSGVLTDFVNAVLDGTPLLADASEGLKSVELANAMVYSEWTQEAVTLPLDSAAYQAALEQAIATSTPRDRVIREAHIDMEKSYS